MEEEDATPGNGLLMLHYNLTRVSRCLRLLFTASAAAATATAATALAVVHRFTTRCVLLLRASGLLIWFGFFGR